eukprot:CAMPEP_0181175434 /NCGR_PEP_ID=MMETSP1096-20121128/4078_1 /TAXON_ID=156174 ORGANISM="Chrysochromulina ericina, Strain CCMP281" /NCGR_SAMPLE_ID=MMETSP1096 /ASSEMBLY_ACC=CAM_ASM_000453 /LENGTH=109 /DNA_ID=CAMNT_0023263423 /DNA_START=1232 /DNA_END=1558 /DNA_ORIENTATION=+
MVIHQRVVVEECIRSTPGDLGQTRQWIVDVVVLQRVVVASCGVHAAGFLRDTQVILRNVGRGIVVELIGLQAARALLNDTASIILVVCVIVVASEVSRIGTPSAYCNRA